MIEPLSSFGIEGTHCVLFIVHNSDQRSTQLPKFPEFPGHEEKVSKR
jgi:hypothetical protein